MHRLDSFAPVVLAVALLATALLAANYAATLALIIG